MAILTDGEVATLAATFLHEPALAAAKTVHHPFRFPDGPLLKGLIYHVAAMTVKPGRRQGIGWRQWGATCHKTWDLRAWR